MALVIADRVRETTTTTGTGAVTLAGAYTSFQTFLAGVGNANSTYYTIASAASGEWEVGIGTYTSSTNTLSRTTILTSSNSGSAVNFSAGAKDVFVTQPAERSLLVQSAGSGLFSKVAAFTANGVPYADSTSTLVTGSGLTFNGTTLAASNISTAGSVTLSGGTANGVLYLNGSKVATSGSALTFDGTNLGIGVASPTLRLQVAVSGATTTFDGLNVTNGTAQYRLGLTGASYSYAGAGANETWLYSAGTTPLTLGPDGNAPIKFVTNGSEQMRLTSTGLGIGISSPGYKLQVYDSSATGGISLRDATYVHLFRNRGNTLDIIADTGATGGDLRFFTNGITQRAIIDSSGNLGLGVTPSAWSTGKAFEVGAVGNGVWGYSTTTYLTQNAYYNGGWKYAASGVAANAFLSQGGAYSWLTAPSGTAGNAITFTQAMTLDASGNLGVGDTLPTSRITVGGSILVAGRGDTYSFKTPDWRMYNSSSGNALVWDNYTTEFMRLDSSGNLLVGRTAAIASARLNVEGSNTSFIGRLRNTSATTPSGWFISYTAAAPNDTGNQFLRCDDNAATRAEIRSNGGLANYSGNNVNLSDRREKTNFAPAGEYLSKICAIPVQTFNYIDQNVDDDPGTTLGVVAQDVQAVAPELVMESNWGTEEEPKMRLSIYQTDLQYALMKCIQEQQALIETLTARVAALES